MLAAFGQLLFAALIAGFAHMLFATSGNVSLHNGGPAALVFAVSFIAMQFLSRIGRDPKDSGKEREHET